MAVGPDALSADRDRALKLTPVSRETAARLDRFVDLLLQWQQKTNLVAASTLGALWTRHIADSLQLLPFAPDARVWVDVGSGAGFPGLVIAIALAESPGAAMHLVESNSKKAAFLREASRVTGVAAHVHAVRVEEFAKIFSGKPDVITARAVAPLKLLLEMTAPLLKTGAQGLFLKGQDVDAELTEASKSWNIEANLLPSKTQQASRVVVVRNVERR
jgi:16S rRNA (guanine527-N7)-methyltransferase